MLKPLILGAALLAASGLASAHDDGYRHGRVITVEPNFVFSFGSRYPDGFRVLVESGGSRYWTYSAYRPGPVIMLPPRPVYYAPYPRRDWDGDRGWERRHERRHDRRDDWHDRR
jgi:hypothetical protein